MIREIRGTVLGVELTGATIDVAGWGVFVHLATPDILKEGATVRLKTYLVIKQDGVDLYGFPDEEDRHFFELLLSVSGVGPKTALSIFRKAPREALSRAIGSRDITYDDQDAEVFDTLIALGYTEREARKTLGAIPPNVVGKDSRLKAALSSGSR